jgi:cobyrinic acid a,c-diamide synthase
MYLCAGIEDLDGARHPMAGLLPGWARMRRDRLHLGYVEAEIQGTSALAVPGARVRGHEFHWAEWERPPDGPPAYRILNQGNRPEGFARGTLMASFLHLHFGAVPWVAERLVATCAAWPR